MAAFAPGVTQSIAVAATSASVTVNAFSSTLRLYNVGNDLVFVRIGQGPQTATLTDFPVVPNVPAFLAKPPGFDTVAAIKAAGGSTDTLYITPGDGGS